MTIVSEKNRETILSTAINTEDYLTYNVGYTDLRISAAVAGGRRHSKSTAVTREVKTEASGKKKEELAAQVSRTIVASSCYAETRLVKMSALCYFRLR